MNPLLISSLLLSFFFTLFFTPLWIKRLRKVGLVSKDMHKLKGGGVAGVGGVPVIFGFLLGVLSYIAIRTFYFGSSGFQVEILALVSSILIMGFIGFMDDILGWKIGLSIKGRLLFFLFGAIPLMVINAGESTMIGLKFGLIYPLILIPIGIVGTAATFNFLAGYNGLETSQGIILLSALSFVGWKTGNSWLSIVGLCMVVSLFTFYIFNKNPAHIFPGNTLTYPLGAMIGIFAIMGNIEKIAVFFFIPYIIEVGLKARGKLKKESFAKLNKDGSLDLPYEKIYGLEHLAIKILKKIKRNEKVYERDVVYLINGFQILIVLLGVIIFL